MVTICAAFTLVAAAGPFSTTASSTERYTAQAQEPAAALETGEEVEIRRLLTAASYGSAEAQSRALVAARQRTAPESLALARALDLLVQSLVEGGKPGDPDALPSATRAVALKEAGAGRDDPAVAVSLSNLGLVLRRQGKLADAQQAYDRALRIRASAFGPDHPEVARTLAALSALASNAGDFARARDLGEQAIRIAEHIDPRDRVLEAVAANNLALALFELNDHAGAKQRFEQALAAYETALGPDHPEVGKTLANLANVVGDSGDLAAARTLYERAIGIQEKRQGPDHPDVALNVNNLAELDFLVGDYASSAALFERARRVLEGAFGPEHNRVAMALGNLAQVRVAQADYREARALYDRALAIREKALGPEHPSLVYTLTGFAELHARLGENDAARAKYQRALAIAERAYGADHPATALSLQGLGDLELAQGHADAAEPLIDRALRIRVALFGNDHPLVAESRAAMALVFARTGRVEAALGAALEAERVSRAHLQITTQALAERQALSYAERRVSGADIALSLLASSTNRDAPTVQRTWDAVVRSRALVFEELAARQRLVAVSSDPAIAELAKHLNTARERLAGLLVVDASRDRVEQAVRDRDTAEQRLAERSAEFRTVQARARTGLADAASRLPQDAALIAFVRYRRSRVEPPSSTRESPVKPGDEYLAFVARGGDATIVAVPLGSADTIDATINQWRAGMAAEIEAGFAAARSERVHRQQGLALRRLIWDPIEPSLAGTHQVFIIPDGPLHLVSWGALPDSNGKYLAERAQLIHYLSSERDLVRIETAVGSGLLLVDNPAYDGSAASRRTPGRRRVTAAPRVCEGLGSLRFDPLPQTGREGDAIAAIWPSLQAGANGDVLLGSITRLTGQAAAETAVRQRMRGSRVVHFATHGFFLGAWCGALVADRAERPLVLAGLALTGANNRPTSTSADDDGILIAEEIATLDLRGVEWVVLSACDTGLGVVAAGEELYGLRRAFQIAGVKTVIVSLWPVDDEITRRWMTAVYKARFVDNKTTAEAMRVATAGVIAERRRRGLSTHPAYWGAFIAAGGW
jgi:CHAT domain-containing protein/Tfp pilus assembly protein PilF